VTPVLNLVHLGGIDETTFGVYNPTMKLAEDNIKKGYTLDDVTSIKQIDNMLARNEERGKPMFEEYMRLENALTEILFAEDAGKADAHMRAEKKRIMAERSKIGLRYKDAEKIALGLRRVELVKLERQQT